MNHLIKRTYVFTGICCLLLCLFPVGFSQDATESSTETEVTSTTTETVIEEAIDASVETAKDIETSQDEDASSTTEMETDSKEIDEVLDEVVTEEPTEESEPTTEEPTEESEPTTEEPAEESEPATEESSVESTEEVPSTDALEETDGEVPASEDSNTELSNSEFTTEESEVAEDPSETETTDTASTQANQRVITVDYSGGNRKAVDFRYGPWIYSHPNEEGVIGTVGTDEDSQLTIYAQEAELKAPEEVLIATAGERVANFTGGVRVARKRLTAIGEALEYSEETGFGELSAEDRIDITVMPKENDGDTTTITAAAATFDVDTDVSVSRGEVTLESGTQSAEAEEITVEQGLDLAVMTSPDGQVTVKRASGEGDLIITADTVRVLTESKKLMASGNVTLVDGAITTTGEVVFFDDAIERAEVFGTPENLAVSIDSEFDVTVKGQRLEQRIDLDIVQILDETAEVIWNEADFLLSSEINSE